MCIVFQVKVGNLAFEVGHLQFAARRTDLLIASIVGLVLGLVAICMLILIIWMKITKRGPFAKKYKEPSAEGVRYSEIAGTQGESNYRLGNHAENREYRFSCFRVLD